MGMGVVRRRRRHLQESFPSRRAALFLVCNRMHSVYERQFNGGYRCIGIAATADRVVITPAVGSRLHQSWDRSRALGGRVVATEGGRTRLISAAGGWTA
jgi:hypothetical protein